MENVLGAIVLTFTAVCLYGSFLMFLDKQRSFEMRRELENRRYNKGQD